MTAEHKSNWQCQECRSKIPKCDNSNTPVKDADSYVTVRNRSNAKAPAVPTSSPPPNSCSTDTTMLAELIAEMRLLREEMKGTRIEIQEFRGTIANLSTAVETCNRRVDELTARVDAFELEKEKTTVSSSSLEQTITELKLVINDRDQELLRNDIEISGIPEENNESRIHYVLTIAQKLGVPLEEKDLVCVERSGPVRRAPTAADGIAGQPPRPRPLAVRFVRRALRDQLLSAARVRRDVTTAGLGTTAPARPLYINERLTPASRFLFYKARGESARAQWKYVWTREGMIFARKEHGSVRHRIRSETDIVKVFGLC
jgi:hypothetical protein